MCGFYFQFNKKKSEFVNSHNILKLLNHRGPDSNGVFKSQRILAIHTLLKIQDISNKSRQPFSIRFRSKKFNIVYNGEIYNKKEIKEKILKKTKYKFKTDGDTEIFLLSFILWGENFIEKIEGMFAYVIWQDETNKIYFGRDQFMQKPLYFFNSKEFLILSSEIKPILHALKFYKKEVIFDNNAIKHYLLTNNFTNNKNTFFKSVNQLDVGKIGSLVKGKIKTKKVLKLKKFNKNKKINDIKQFESFSENIVKQHLIGKVKTGIALSSGADSQYLLYLISKNKKLSKNLTAFTFGFEKFNNEIKNAQKICKKLNIDHSVIYLKENEIFDDFQKLIRFCEFPVTGVPTIAMYKLCKKAKESGIKVLIGGYGADEHFGSYRTFLQKKLKDNQFVDSRIFDNRIFIKNLTKKNKYQNKHFEGDFYEKKINYFLNLKIPRTSLMCDRFSMSNSLEFRNPFLDRRMYNFINQLKYKHLQSGKKDIIIKILKNNDLFKNNYKKNYLQSPQIQYMKNKNVIKFLENIVNDTQFLLCFNFLKINGIVRKIKKNQILAWQIMNIYYLFQTFRKFIYLREPINDKK